MPEFLCLVILVSAVALAYFYVAGRRVQVANALMQPAQVYAGLNALGEEIVEINRANGWNVTVPEDWSQNAYKVPAVLALIHSEVSEALEAFRQYDSAHFNEELADVLIRVLDAASGLGVDMDAEVRAKLEKNKTRGFRHGNKRV